jgi:predicted regulator of Ras-like GTPase activity (Roadblock/LC7/MglB family)
MEHGIRKMSRQQLKQDYDKAMAAGAYGVAERVAYEMNEPRTTYVPSCRAPKAA